MAVADNNKDLKLLLKSPVKILKKKAISPNEAEATVDAVAMTRIEAVVKDETVKKIKIHGFTSTITIHVQPIQKSSSKSTLNWKSFHQKTK